MAVRRAVTATLAILVMMAGCGGEAQAPPPTPTPTEEADVELSVRDLHQALIDADDIPSSHGTDFRPFTLDVDALPNSDDVTGGPAECGDYLDDAFAADPIKHADQAFGDPTSSVTVWSSIELYDPGDAADEFDEIRFLMTECDGFTMRQGGETMQVVTDLAELDETPGYEKLGDDGLRVGLLIVRQGVPFRGTARTVIRVGDLIGSVWVEVPANFGRDPSPELTELLEERLRDLGEGDSSW